MKNSVFTRTKQLRRNLVSTTQAIPKEAYLLTNTNTPAGAMGPGDRNTIFEMHVWLQQYSGQGDFDSQGASDGFALNNQGTIIGADRLVGEALTLGLNYTYARSSARTTGMDDLDSETYWLGAYGEWVGKEGLYVDALVAYGLSNYDTERREEDYQGTASYDGRSFGAYADVGQYYHSGRLALSPYAGIHVLTIVTDGHDETDALGSSVYVDEVSRNLVESALGLKMRHRFDTRIGRFQTTGYAEWAHDFIEDDVSATMTAAGFPPVGTTAISPDADTVNVGLGYSWISREYMEVGIGYAGRFSENYAEHAGSLMLDIMF
jgi:outer membrane autotransporter protein